MRTIVLQKVRYLNGQDIIIELIYRGTHWEIDNKNKDEYPIVVLYDEDRPIAMHRTWDNISFSDTLVKEITS